MALTNTFHEAVASNSVRKVRIMMKDSLLIDPTFGQFKEMEREAATMEHLYDEHDGRDFRVDKDSWNDDYMDELMVQVVGNFSHERIEHLKEVVRYLRPVVKKPEPDKDSGNGQRKKTLSYQEQKEKDQREGRYLGEKVAAGVIVGGIVGGIAATVVDASVAIGVLAGAGVAGAVVYIGTAERNK